MIRRFSQRGWNPRRLGLLVALAAALVGSCSPVWAGTLAFSLNLTAHGMAFDQGTLTVPAGASVTVHFTNSDSGTPHNLAVYETSAATKAIFQGKRITGPQTVDYAFAAPTRPGVYFFRCDVHPATMTGRFVVVPAIAVSLTAVNVSFDRTSITVPAGAYVTVHFSNNDVGIPHTFSVYTSATGDTAVFRGAAIAGPATVDYTFFAPATAGRFAFRCDVHPTMMRGDFVVVPLVAVDLVAHGMAFDKKTITVPQGAYVAMHFTNEDAWVEHNFAVYCCSSARTTYFQGSLIAGPQAIDYGFFAPDAPGTYFFRCDVHPSQMNGDFAVTAPAA
jgi:plastocyanin